MCADPEMMRTLAAEIREELDKRRALREAGGGRVRWPAVACMAVAGIAVLALV